MNEQNGLSVVKLVFPKRVSLRRRLVIYLNFICVPIRGGI